MAMRLDPQDAQNMITQLETMCNKDFVALAIELRDAAVRLGEDTPIAEEFKKKFANFETVYNEDLLPKYQSVADAYQSCLDLSVKINTMSGDTTAKMTEETADASDIVSDVESAMAAL